MSTEATIPNILTDLMKSCEPHPLFDKSEAPNVKFHKYVESNSNNDLTNLFNEVGTLNISENGDKIDVSFDRKKLDNHRIKLYWFISTNPSPKNCEINKVIDELYEKGYKNVTYDVTKIKLFTPNWFQKNILRQNSFKYFDCSDEYWFLFEADQIVKKNIDTTTWSHI